MRPPRIGVTCTTVQLMEQTGYVGPVDAAPSEFGTVLSRCGTIPVLIPLRISIDCLTEYLKLLDGVVLTGGPDIGRSSGERGEPLTGGLDVHKDRLEWQICGLALACGIPLLGICRGLQVINLYLGGTLYDDLPRDCPSDVAHRSPAEELPAVHPVSVAPGSKLSAVFGGLKGSVNSYHHQAVKLLAPTLRATAWAPDGVIEGLESLVYRSLLAVQFHPELDDTDSAAALNVFRWLACEATQFLLTKEEAMQGPFREEKVG